MEIKYPIENPHTLSVEEVLQVFQTDAVAGISQSEVAKRSKEFGLNVYQAQKPKPIWLMIIQQFNSPIVYLLLVGTGVSVYFQDYIEAIAIGVVILLNAIIGFSMEL